MNTKILIPVLLTTLSGCSVAPSVDIAQEGGGGGATRVEDTDSATDVPL